MSEYRFVRSRWALLTFNEQMGNIGSEVGLIAHQCGNLVRENRAIDRAIDLFGATVEVLIGTSYSYRL